MTAWFFDHLCPRAFTAMPPDMSRKRFPSVSIRYAPSPWVNTTCVTRAKERRESESNRLLS